LRFINHTKLTRSSQVEKLILSIGFDKFDILYWTGPGFGLNITKVTDIAHRPILETAPVLR
jgi:hypothetical protein